jgi:hypothetical protein
MATYTFRNKDTDEIEEHSMRMSEYDPFVRNNPNLERYHTPGSVLNIVGGVGGIKNDQGWKEVLSKVSEAHPSSALASKTTSRSIKQVKTEQAVKKHLKV